MSDPPGPDPFEAHLATFTACLGQFVKTLSCWGTEADRGDDRSAFADAPRHILNRALVRDALNLDAARWAVRPHLDRMDDHLRGEFFWSERVCTRIFQRWGLANSRHAVYPPDVAGWRWTLPDEENLVNAIHYGPALTVRDDEVRALAAAAKLSLMEGRPKARGRPTATKLGR